MPTPLKIRAFRIAQRLRRAFAPKHRAHRAFTLPELHEQHGFTAKARGRFAFRSPKLRGRSTRPRRAVSSRRNNAQAEAFSEGGFTLIELLVVMGIIIILTALLAPAFTTLKSAGDVTTAAYTIKGVLDQARTYAMANNTYTWVGFYEENVSQPSPNSANPKIGRVVISVVASKDGTTIYNSSSPGTIDPTRLLQVGKLTKIENVHLWTHTDAPSGTGSTLDTRPNVTSTYCIGDTSPPNSTNTLFQYPVGNPAPAPQYTFLKGVQFSPGGVAQIVNSTTSYSPQTAAEMALEPTHGNVAPSPSPIPANVVAIQFTGIGGNVKVYRR